MSTVLQKSSLIRHMSDTHFVLQHSKRKLKLDGHPFEAELSTQDVFCKPSLGYPKRFNCSKCPKICTNRQMLREHSLKIHGFKGPINYKCEECGKIFIKLHSFSLHSNIHKPPPFSCSECDRKFFSKPGMLLHKRSVHLGRKPKEHPGAIMSASCQQCPKMFASTEALRGHMKRIHQPQEHKCPHCYKEFTTKGELNFHLLKAHSLHVKLDLECNICHKEFQNASSLVSHSRFHGPPALSCSHCPLKFYAPAQLSQHIKRCHTNVVRFPMPPITNSKKVLSFTCAVCCRPLGSRKDLRKHLTTHYPKAQVCPVCQQTFNSETGFEAHIRRKHPETRETFNCDSCNKLFLNRERYLIHKRFHERRTQANIETSLLGRSKSQNRLQQTTKRTKFSYDCPISGKEFPNPSNFSSHLLVHQKITFDCSRCPATLSSRSNLRQHSLTQHGIDPTLEPTRYECDECGGIFTSSHSLTLHSATHKPPQFSCNECDRKFFKWTAMFSHKKIVHFGKKTKVPHNTSELSCEKCPMKFQTALTLKTHLSNVHQPKEHKCPHCYKEFSMVYQLNNHLLKAHSLRVEQVFKCNICHKSCKDQAGLVSHSRFHGNPTLSCAQCPLKFYTHSLLPLHTKRRHNVSFTMPHKSNRKEINYICAVCCRPFASNKKGLEHHLQTHYFKPQLCPVCQQTFNSDRTFRDHIRQNHPDSRKTFYCDFCTTTFSSQARYQSHMRYHQKATMACPDCPLLFYSKMSLRSHSNSHDSKAHRGYLKIRKVFSCAICLRQFSVRRLLSNHLINTHNPIAFGCSKCDFQCYIRDGIIRHLRKFHADPPNHNCVSVL